MKHKGAITLLMVTVLVILASMTGLFTARSVLSERWGNNNSVWSVQAQLTAQAALETALAQIEVTNVQTFWAGHDAAQCLPGYTGLEWQCRGLTLDPWDTQGHTVQVRVMRDLIQAPHVALVHAQAQHAGQHSSAHAQQSLYLPLTGPIGSASKITPLLTQGCVSEAIPGSTRLCAAHSNANSIATCSGTALQSLYVPDLDGNGLISLAEQKACMRVDASSLQGGAVVTPSQATAAPNPTGCDSSVWSLLFGSTTPTQIQAISAAQALKGLSASTQPARSVYWVDSPADWTQNVGTASAPVLLVFSATACASQCPKISAQVVGTVYLDTQCQDSRASQWAGQVQGQLAAPSGLPDLQPGSQFNWLSNHRQAFDWPWPVQIDATRVQRVRGSWKNGG
jgi:hypothetical protein